MRHWTSVRSGGRSSMTVGNSSALAPAESPMRSIGPARTRDRPSASTRSSDICSTRWALYIHPRSQQPVRRRLHSPSRSHRLPPRHLFRLLLGLRRQAPRPRQRRRQRQRLDHHLLLLLPLCQPPLQHRRLWPRPRLSPRQAQRSHPPLQLHQLRFQRQPTTGRPKYWQANSSLASAQQALSMSGSLGLSR